MLIGVAGVALGILLAFPAARVLTALLYDTRRRAGSALQQRGPCRPRAEVKAHP